MTSLLTQIRTSLASASLSHHSGSRAWPACVGVWKAAAPASPQVSGGRGSSQEVHRYCPVSFLHSGPGWSQWLEDLSKPRILAGLPMASGKLLPLLYFSPEKCSPLVFAKCFQALRSKLPGKWQGRGAPGLPGPLRRSQRHRETTRLWCHQQVNWRLAQWEEHLGTLRVYCSFSPVEGDMGIGEVFL